jgi:hypothetical protein
MYIEINVIKNCKYGILSRLLCQNNKILYKLKTHTNSSYVPKIKKTRGIEVTKAPSIFLNIDDNYKFIGDYNEFKKWIEIEYPFMD